MISLYFSLRSLTQRSCKPSSVSNHEHLTAVRLIRQACTYYLAPAVLWLLIPHPFPLQRAQASLDSPSIPMPNCQKGGLVRVVGHQEELLASCAQPIYPWSADGVGSNHAVEDFHQGIVICRAIPQIAQARGCVGHRRNHQRLTSSHLSSQLPHILPPFGELRQIRYPFRACHGRRHTRKRAQTRAHAHTSHCSTS